ncbi:MAG: hypothetical protein LBP30_06280 [Clostridiales Family XIII bacterium]|jgi:hypothetical protein|nr:hypothetical protein [Clostridiales Family XIII bacterium]
MRGADEGISIPLLAKHDLCSGFCSDNSGMQGSRAVEKMRSLKRLDADFDTAQRTVFDLKLFAAIDVRKFLADTADPELTKCVVAACLDVIFAPHGCMLAGVEDYKTAADARARKPGDLCVVYNGEPRIAVEVKDKTQTIDWNNIERAKKIIDANGAVRDFVFVLERKQSISHPIIAEMFSAPKFDKDPYNRISIVSFQDMYLLALSIADSDAIAAKTSEFIALAPAIKPETKDRWIDAVNKAINTQAEENDMKSGN